MKKLDLKILAILNKYEFSTNSRVSIYENEIYPMYVAMAKELATLFTDSDVEHQQYNFYKLEKSNFVARFVKHEFAINLTHNLTQPATIIEFNSLYPTIFAKEFNYGLTTNIAGFSKMYSYVFANRQKFKHSEWSTAKAYRNAKFLLNALYGILHSKKYTEFKLSSSTCPIEQFMRNLMLSVVSSKSVVVQNVDILIITGDCSVDKLLLRKFTELSYELTKFDSLDFVLNSAARLKSTKSMILQKYAKVVD